MELTSFKHLGKAVKFDTEYYNKLTGKYEVKAVIGEIKSAQLSTIHGLYGYSVKPLNLPYNNGNREILFLDKTNPAG